MEFLTLLIWVIYSKKYWNSPSMYILIYLFIFFLLDSLAGLVFCTNNQWLYNLLSFFEVFILSLVFYRSTIKILHKRAIGVLFILSLSMVVIDGFFITESFLGYLSYGFGLSSISIAIMCFIYLNAIARTEKILNVSRILLFWVVVGLLFYHLCVLPITVMVNQLDDIGNTENLLLIQSLSSIVMYVSFIIGFIWTQKEYNT
ncbi:MAG: hypothetical protein ACI86M_002557 [Saprospiraceae bacterium]|jgi:hypothetical protein